MFDELLCTPAETAYRKTALRRTQGVFGGGRASFGVVETQGRGALHIHMLHWSSYSPELLQHAARDAPYRDALLAAMSTMVQTQLERQIHVQALVRRAAAAARPPDAPKPPAPTRESRKLPPAFAAVGADGASRVVSQAWRTRADTAAAATCVHTHSATCHKGRTGDIGCRMAMPQPLTPAPTVQQVCAFARAPHPSI